VKEKGEERLFMNEAAVRDDASNIGRSIKGSDIMYQEREAALIGQANDAISRDATEQNYINRNEAMYSRNFDH